VIGRVIDDVREEDLQQLVEQNVSEGRSLEFKRELPGGSDAEVKEFLADVTSLANAQGGDLIFGVEDNGGAASALAPLSVADPDAAILRLENTLRDGVEPRLAGVRSRWIPLAAGGGAVVLRIPSSLAAPHRIKFKNSGRFYTRNSRGKYEMDTHELRAAFNSSEQMPLKLRELHAQAVRMAEGSDVPFCLAPDPSAVMSIMPITFLREVRDVQPVFDNALLPPRISGGIDYFHTLEGLIVHPPKDDDSNHVRSFALTHSSGRIDVAWTVGATRDIGGGAQRKLVWPKLFRDGVMDVAKSGTNRLRAFGIEGPWVIFLSMMHMNGSAICFPDRTSSRTAWRDHVTLPEIVSDAAEERDLKPFFDALLLLFGLKPDNYAYLFNL
jgi:hypothetical protein